MTESSTALRTASEMRGLDTSKVVIDDDQAPPKIEAGSADEQAALAAMEDLLADGSPSKAASADLKLMCLRGRKYDAARAAALLPELLALIEELDLATPTPRLAADLASGKFVMTGATDGAGRKILWLRFRWCVHIYAAHWRNCRCTIDSNSIPSEKMQVSLEATTENV